MTTSDDGVPEIQLNGKQLVFLVMAVTVVSVVIFLCGVLVGRGVQARPATAETTPAVEAADVAADAAPPATPPSGPTKAEDLGYTERLQSPEPTAENLVTRPDPPRTGPPVVAAATANAAVPTGAAPSGPAPLAPAEAAATPIPAEPKGDGVAIQVAALKVRSEAEAVVERLKGKGYNAYLMAPLDGQPSVFRVRVGKFKTRSEAEAIATRLEREEQFKPWITR
jgi:cell division septation protein DedD